MSMQINLQHCTILSLVTFLYRVVQLHIQVSQVSFMRQQTWGEVVVLYHLPQQYIWEYNSERIIKIGLHLPKLLQK